MNSFKNIDEYFEAFSSALLSYTNYYNENIVLKILENELYVDEPHRFFYTLLSKSNSSLDVSSFLVRNFYNKLHFHPSLFILLRSMLSDIIIGEYVIANSMDETETKKIIDGIYLDHVLRTFKSIEGIYARLSSWTQTDMKEERSKFVSVNQKYFGSNNELLVKPIDISPLKAMNRIIGNLPKGSDLSFYRKLYSHYDLFSKYEHLGELTFRLVHKPFMEASIRELFFDVIESIGIIISALNNYCNIWGNLFLEEKKDLKNLTEDIFKYSSDILP